MQGVTAGGGETSARLEAQPRGRRRRNCNGDGTSAAFAGSAGSRGNICRAGLAKLNVIARIRIIEIIRTLFIVGLLFVHLCNIEPAHNGMGSVRTSYRLLELNSRRPAWMASQSLRDRSFATTVPVPG